MFVQHLGDIEREVEPDEDRLLHRAEHGGARAKSFLNDGIDGCGIAYASRDQREGFALHRVLQPLADEARNVAAHMHRRFAGVAQQVHRGAHDSVAGFLVLDDFDQRYQVRRIPEMRADDAIVVFEIAPDLRRRYGRAVARQDRSGGDRALEVGENLLLERQLFRCRLEHEAYVLHRLSHVLMRRDALEQRCVVAEQIEDCGKPPRHRSADFSVRLEHADFVTRRGQQIRDAMAHQAAADHADSQFLHARLGMNFSEPQRPSNVGYLSAIYQPILHQEIGYAGSYVGHFLVLSDG